MAALMYEYMIQVLLVPYKQFKFKSSYLDEINNNEIHIFATYLTRRYIFHCKIKNGHPKRNSSMFAIYIEVFDNGISNITDLPIHMISLTGWKVPYSENSLDSINAPNIFYDNTWTVCKLINEERNDLIYNSRRYSQCV
ncbi:hypothetical protein RF11_13619 [Thelohanellus kitauei]|uniref:Uncharacterized protein n=1 Tax=Thelohanellus kitauei TaxID=669202 RepID=A0A0C2MPW1_THEKT|nr:hypothetical protein RF11_13619 [Thelohanellus kitauei]